jgi:hypothetical protein
VAPCRASSKALADPMPPPPPVTTATRPLNGELISFASPCLRAVSVSALSSLFAVFVSGLSLGLVGYLVGYRVGSSISEFARLAPLAPHRPAPAKGTRVATTSLAASSLFPDRCGPGTRVSRPRSRHPVSLRNTPPSPSPSLFPFIATTASGHPTRTRTRRVGTVLSSAGPCQLTFLKSQSVLLNCVVAD